MAWRGGFLARIRGEMDSEARFDEDVLFTVRKTEFEEKCPRVDVYHESARGGGRERGNGTVDVLETV